MRLIDYINQGGSIMYILLFLNIIGLATMGHKFYTFFIFKTLKLNFYLFLFLGSTGLRLTWVYLVFVVYAQVLCGSLLVIGNPTTVLRK